MTTPTIKERLLPCPFCSSPNLELCNTHTASFWVQCNDCRATAHGEYFEGRKRNTRFSYTEDPRNKFEAGYTKLHPEYRQAADSAIQRWNTRPSSPIADRLADALKALLEEANAYASLMPASEEGSPSGEAEAILAEYDAQRSSADGWVSVEERLPEDERLVVASGLENDEDALRWATVSTFYDGVFYDDSSGEELRDVTHWMPIQPPQPPKGATT